MNIIKPGLSKEELEAKLKAVKRFQCTTCGCIFEADDDEYEYEEDYIYCTYYCKCPNCERTAFEARTR